MRIYNRDNNDKDNNSSSISDTSSDISLSTDTPIDWTFTLHPYIITYDELLILLIQLLDMLEKLKKFTEQKTKITTEQKRYVELIKKLELEEKYKPSVITRLDYIDLRELIELFNNFMGKFTLYFNKFLDVYRNVLQWKVNKMPDYKPIILSDYRFPIVKEVGDMIDTFKYNVKVMYDAIQIVPTFVPNFPSFNTIENDIMKMLGFKK